MSDPLQRHVRREYARLAPEYDSRWAGYVRESTERAVDALARRPALRLLDIGCGTGALLARVLDEAPGARAFGIDLSRAMLRRARETLRGRAALAQADAAALPFRAASFDAVVSASSLHYWPEPALAIREAARVLRPDGQLVLVDWCADFLSSRLLTLALRVRRRPLGRVFGSDELASLLRRSGFAGVAVQSFRAGAWGMMTVTARREAP